LLGYFSSKQNQLTPSFDGLSLGYLSTADANIYFETAIKTSLTKVINFATRISGVKEV
jgi:hypothetical protein